MALFEALKVWRKQLADEYSRPAYTVFADETLRSIAVVKPKTLSSCCLFVGWVSAAWNLWGTGFGAGA